MPTAPALRAQRHDAVAAAHELAPARLLPARREDERPEEGLALARERARGVGLFGDPAEQPPGERHVLPRVRVGRGPGAEAPRESTERRVVGRGGLGRGGRREQRAEGAGEALERARRSGAGRRGVALAPGRDGRGRSARRRRIRRRLGRRLDARRRLGGGALARRPLARSRASLLRHRRRERRAEAEEPAELRVDGARPREGIARRRGRDRAREATQAVAGELEPERGARGVECGEGVARRDEREVAEPALRRELVVERPQHRREPRPAGDEERPHRVAPRAVGLEGVEQRVARVEEHREELLPRARAPPRRGRPASRRR